MVGLSHQTASVEFRERIALDQAGVVRTLTQLREATGVAEALVLSTCNRTEMYAVVQGSDSDVLLEVLSDSSGVPRHEIEAHLYWRREQEVVEHLFMVAAGLDSMVVGENQIQAQVREAYSRSVACRTNGPVLNKLLHRSLRVGKQIRSRTGIGQGRLSVASVACDLADKILSNLDRRSVLLLGAGETGELVVRHLRDRGVRCVTIVNRTPRRAEELAAKLGGKTLPYEGLWDAIGQVDVLITATSATEPVITTEHMTPIAIRRRTPLFIIDIAVPRDVESEVNALRDVFLYDIDALEIVVEASMGRRRAEVHRARAMVAAEMAKFDGWQRSQRATPTIVQMREQFETIRSEELEKLRTSLGDDDYARVERATHRMVAKMLHHPTVQMKQAARRPDSGPLLKAFRQLLGLEEEGG